MMRLKKNSRKTLQPKLVGLAQRKRKKLRSIQLMTEFLFVLERQQMVSKKNRFGL